MKFKQQWNNFPIRPEKVPFFYGWVILFASTAGVLASTPGQTMGIATFTEYLLENIHISRNQISVAYMIGTIASSCYSLTPEKCMISMERAGWQC